LHRYGKEDSGSLFSKMAQWLQRKLPVDAKDDMNHLEDFLDIAFNAMVLDFAATRHGFDPKDGVPIQCTQVSWLFQIVQRVSPSKHPLVCPEKSASQDTLNQWMNSFIRPLAENVAPHFHENAPAPSGVFSNDELENEALFTFQFLTLYKLLKEALKVADGELLMSLYKPNLAVFDKFHRTKYRLEMLHFLVMKNATLSARDAFDLTWNRFANTKGKVDSNFELDRRMEHRIKQAKGFILRLGPNFTIATAQRYTRSLDSLEIIAADLEKTFECPVTTTRHADPDTALDEIKLAQYLHSLQVFQRTEGRKSLTGVAFKSLYQVDKIALQSWMRKALRNIQLGTTWVLENEQQEAASGDSAVERSDPEEIVPPETQFADPVEPELEYLFPAVFEDRLDLGAPNLQSPSFSASDLLSSSFGAPDQAWFSIDTDLNVPFNDPNSSQSPLSHRSPFSLDGSSSSHSSSPTAASINPMFTTSWATTDDISGDIWAQLTEMEEEEQLARSLEQEQEQEPEEIRDDEEGVLDLDKALLNEVPTSHPRLFRSPPASRPPPPPPPPLPLQPTVTFSGRVVRRPPHLDQGGR